MTATTAYSATSPGTLAGAGVLGLDDAQSLHIGGQTWDSSTGAVVITVVEYPTRAGVRSRGAGCTVSGAAPFTAAAVGRPQIPNPGFGFTLSDGPPALVQGIAFAQQLAATPLPFGAPGCTFLLDPATVLLTLVLPGGSMALPIPAVPTLLGVRLHLQGVALDANTGLFVTSNGLDMLLGG